MFRGYVSTGYNLKCILCPLGKCPGDTCLGGFILSPFAFFLCQRDILVQCHETRALSNLFILHAYFRAITAFLPAA